MSSDYTTFSGSLLDEMQSDGNTTLIPGLRASFPRGQTDFESSPTPPSPMAFGRHSSDVASTSSRHSSRHSRHGSGAYHTERLNDVRFNMPTGLFDSRSDQRLQIIALTDEDTLSRSRNGVYLACMQRTEQLKMECTGLQVKITMYKKLYDNLLHKFPQLIGITGTLNPSGDDAALGPSQTPMKNQVVFGRGLELPTALPSPSGITFTFWHRQTWTSRKKIPQARQYNNDDINVAQIYAEDETGQPVSGLVARDMRQTVGRLLHSLRWSGQIALTASELMDEAYVYLHATLAHRFPFLLFCEAGRWKIDILISQVYPGFKTNHLAKADAQSAIKAESVHVDLSSSSSAVATKSNTKRERSPSATASSQPRKKVAGNIHTATSDTLVVQAHPMGPSGSGRDQASDNGLKDTYDSEMVLPDSIPLEKPAKPTPQMIPLTKRYTITVRPPRPADNSASTPADNLTPVSAATVPLAPTVTAAPARNPAAAASINMAGLHAAAAPIDVAAPASVLTPIRAGAATTPVTVAPVAITADIQAGGPVAIAMLASPGTIHAIPPIVVAPVDNIASTLAGPSASMCLPATSSTPAPFTQQATSTIEPSAIIAATAAPPAHATETSISALPPPTTPSDSVLPAAVAVISTNEPPSAAPKSKGWTKAQCLKAAIKFKPETISEKNLHMKTMIDANPDVTVGECAESFTKLSSREFENLKAEVQSLRREKRAARNTKQ